MAKSRADSHHWASLVLGLDLVVHSGPGWQGVAALADVPGRAKANLKEWECVDGRPSWSQLEDIVAWTADQAHSAVMTWCGVQEVLET